MYSPNAYETVLIVTQVRICAKHLSDIIATKRMALRASLEVSVFYNIHMGFTLGF